MDFDYQTMRTFADSWGLLYMFLVFVGVVLWVIATRCQELPAKMPPKFRSRRTENV